VKRGATGLYELLSHPSSLLDGPKKIWNDPVGLSGDFDNWFQSQETIGDFLGELWVGFVTAEVGGEVLSVAGNVTKCKFKLPKGVFEPGELMPDGAVAGYPSSHRHLAG
jgi:hypothetical protein